jgi:WD40 repeat protein
VQVNRYQFFLCIVVAMVLTSCNAPGSTPVTTVASPTRLVASTKAVPTSTLALPTETQSATSTPVEAEPEVTKPALFERSSQDLGLQETVQAAVGDLDGDGDLDAVFANPMRSHSQVWLNDGSGWFENTGQELTQYGHGVGLADLDEDGDLDAFIVCHQFITGSKIYLNDGSGMLTDSGQNLKDTELSGVEIHLIDLNGDGYMDAHVAYYDPAGLPDRVYLNDGLAKFRDSGLTLDEDTIAWGDLDQDGDIDYFGKRVGEGYVIQLNNGSGSFQEGWQMKDEDTTIGAVALADFDQDGDLDALVTNGHRTTGYFPSRLLWNKGDGTFIDSQQQLNDTSGAELAVGDLDLDGDLDVVVSNMDRPNEVWLNVNAQLIDSGLRLGDISELSGRPTLGDLDEDGDLDLIMGRFQGGAEIWFNTTISPEIITNSEFHSTQINSNLAKGTSPALLDMNRELIAFSSNVDGDFEIWIMNPDGSNQRNLTNNDASDLSPAWSPDGNKIAFVSHRDGNDEIYVMNAEGNAVKRLTDTEDASESFPSWSPDGEKISFDSNRDGNWEIYVMASDGTDVQRLTYNPAEDWISEWSPDGSHIVFESKRDGNYEIYVMSFDGSEQRRLTNNLVHDGFPAWSPDGKQIAFMSNRDGDCEIYIMNADGSHQRQLTRNSFEDSDPDWSEDGEWLVYVSQTSGNDEIYIVKVENGEIYPITSNEAQNWSPCWHAKP